MTTLAPCAARASTTALPIPVFPPVTIATLPCSSSVMLHLPGAPAEGAVSSDVLPYRVGEPDAIDHARPSEFTRRLPKGHWAGDKQEHVPLRAPDSSQSGDARHS